MQMGTPFQLCLRFGRCCIYPPLGDSAAAHLQGSRL